MLSTTNQNKNIYYFKMILNSSTNHLGIFFDFLRFFVRLSECE